MLKTRFGYIICFSIILSLFVYSKSINTKSMEVSFSQPNSDKSEQERIQELEQRLDFLEPPEPTTILDSPFPFEKGTEVHFPTDVIPISEVLKEGTKIPFQVMKSEPNYIRPIYEEDWHSTSGRWSYIPSRIYYALHRIFPYYAFGLSAELDFTQNVGISFPTDRNEADLDLYIVVFQTNITDVYTKGNQVVVVGTPKRTGVEVLSIKTADIHPSNKEKLLLVQLATNGAELDYSLIRYEAPDYWLKLKQKNEREKSKKE
ncbi:MAG TPA: hypothetical protein K8V56_10455 [Sporosarcina psychrophila]|uniref:Uncharacterized protein n=1 Tax=Sporosarcina psychrophila TaxID=1476 RepID=A0A921FYS4_SPOPS|nr:hypothetical protein [Sporosarcina psychrophila]